MSKFNWSKAVEKLYEKLQEIKYLEESESKERKMDKYNLKCEKLYDKADEYGLKEFINFKFEQLMEEDEEQIRREEFLYY